MGFAHAIARLREDLGLNQKQLAKQLGLSPGAVSRWVDRSDPQPCSPRTLKLLKELASAERARELQISWDRLKNPVLAAKAKASEVARRKLEELRHQTIADIHAVAKELTEATQAYIDYRVDKALQERMEENPDIDWGDQEEVDFWRNRELEYYHADIKPEEGVPVAAEGLALANDIAHEKLDPFHPSVRSWIRLATLEGARQRLSLGDPQDEALRQRIVNLEVKLEDAAAERDAAVARAEDAEAKLQAQAAEHSSALTIVNHIARTFEDTTLGQIAAELSAKLTLPTGATEGKRGKRNEILFGTRAPDAKRMQKVFGETLADVRAALARLAEAAEPRTDAAPDLPQEAREALAAIATRLEELERNEPGAALKKLKGLLVLL